MPRWDSTFDGKVPCSEGLALSGVLVRETIPTPALRATPLKGGVFKGSRVCRGSAS